MVRLKEEKGDADVYETVLFQFHNGSIKGGLTQSIRSRVEMFQFHNGSIKGLCCCSRFLAVGKVSIPQWFD